MESSPQGVEEPNPTLPLERKVVVAVPPNSAKVEENLVEEAAPLRRRSEVVALCPVAGWVKGSVRLLEVR